MPTALDTPLEELDSQERYFVAQVREYGWMATHVIGDEEGPGFSYTTGFWLKFRFPEVFLFSLPQKTAHDIFWLIHDQCDAERLPPIGVPTNDLFRKFPAVLLPMSVNHYRRHLGQSIWFYRGYDFDCLQLVFPDRKGHFPWSSEPSDEFRALQPDLTEGDWAGLCNR